MATSLQEARRRESWAVIQAAALELVSRRGFDAVTVEQIAAEAGVSRRTFFNHFPSKAAALFAARPDDQHRLEELLARSDVRTAGVWAALGETFVAYVADSEIVLPIHRRLVRDDPEMVSYHRAAYMHVALVLDRWIGGQVSGDVFEATLLREAVLAVLHGAFHAWDPDEDPSAYRRLVEQGFERIGTGLGG